MATPGPYTGIDLEDTSCLYDRTGAAQHALTRASACLSLELARTAYTLALDPWERAGWTDFSILADDTLLTGDDLNGPSTPLGELTRGVRQTLTHLQMTLRDPLTQYLGMRRLQDENASACKAVVMVRRFGAFYLIGVGFMGTGKRLFDWIPNLRFLPENGYHAGFWQLTEQFLQKAPAILLNQTARDMGRERLTLQDVLEDMKKPGTRFRLWLCGHSQGAAVMQITADQAIQSGVPAPLMTGFGFASPTVLQEKRPDGETLPIFHILNADDLVPRTGANAHLGRCLFFSPTQVQRMEMYPQDWPSPCFRETLRFFGQAESTQDCLLMGLVFMRLSLDLSEDTVSKLLAGTEGLPLPDWLRPSGDFSLPALEKAIALLENQYLALTGQDALPRDRLDDIERRYRDMMGRYGTLVWWRTALRAAAAPHHLCADTARGEPPAAYQYIVTRHTEDLTGMRDGIAVSRVWKPAAAASRPAPRLSVRQRPLRPVSALPAAPARPQPRLTLNEEKPDEAASAVSKTPGPASEKADEIPSGKDPAPSRASLSVTPAPERVDPAALRAARMRIYRAVRRGVRNTARDPDNDKQK